MFAEIRHWELSRWLTSAGVSVAVATGLLFLAGVFQQPAPGALQTPLGWEVPAIALSAVLAGLLIASYVRPAIGAEVTFCDVRWPGLSLALTAVGTQTASAQTLVTGVARPAVALAAIGVLAWALIARLRLEHDLRLHALRVASGEEPAEGMTCTTCRPLFSRISQ
ncbi:hypothetical protein [Subtercola frigoramans]|uniref:Uncharacterized protein n=1 Tax=Subtercola frigoramans TaxID=120298 RepID=A0ABS2L1V1_9MICO|nr:hypothetical protein [Subtercola frigoramans]MBM7470750.1 hypothetical protein [Subtercola frigoramans]